MRKYAQIIVALLAAFILIMAAVGAIRASSDQPPAVVAPLEAARISVINTAAIAQDTNFSAVIWGVNQEADLFYRVTMSGVNTTALELEVSPDNLYWYDSVLSPTLTTVTTSTNGYVNDIPVHGYYFRIVANVTNGDTLTPNLKMVLRP